MLRLKRPIVSFDLETTGTNPETDRAIQFGGIKLFLDGTTKEFEILINPEIPIPPETTKVHHITDEMVKDELPFELVGPKIKIFLRDCDVCGYNIQFDYKILVAEFKRVSIPWNPEFKAVDAFKIFQLKERRSLEAAVKFYLDREHKNSHTSLSDAKAALEVIQAQLKRYDDLPRDVDELSDLLFLKPEPGFVDPDKKFIWKNGEVVFNFGKKFKGLPLKNASTNYLTWMLGTEFSKPVKQIVRDALNGKYPVEPR